MMRLAVVALAALPVAAALVAESLSSSTEQTTTTATATATGGRKCLPKRCNDACASAVDQASLGGVSTALEDCSTAMPTITFTTTATTSWVEGTSSTAAPVSSSVALPRRNPININHPAQPQNSQGAQTVPSYASACSDFAQYTSACLCAGATRQTVTVPTSAMTSTLASSAADTDTTTSQAQSTTQSSAESATQSSADSTSQSSTESTSQSSADSTSQSSADPTTTSAQSQPTGSGYCASYPGYPYEKCCSNFTNGVGNSCTSVPNDGCSTGTHLCCDFDVESSGLCTAQSAQIVD